MCLSQVAAAIVGAGVGAGHVGGGTILYVCVEWSRPFAEGEDAGIRFKLTYP